MRDSVYFKFVYVCGFLISGIFTINLMCTQGTVGWSKFLYGVLGVVIEVAKLAFLFKGTMFLKEGRKNIGYSCFACGILCMLVSIVSSLSWSVNQENIRYNDKIKSSITYKQEQQKIDSNANKKDETINSIKDTISELELQRDDYKKTQKKAIEVLENSTINNKNTQIVEITKEMSRKIEEYNNKITTEKTNILKIESQEEKTVSSETIKKIELKPTTGCTALFEKGIELKFNVEMFFVFVSILLEGIAVISFIVCHEKDNSKKSNSYKTNTITKEESKTFISNLDYNNTNNNSVSTKLPTMIKYKG